MSLRGGSIPGVIHELLEDGGEVSSGDIARAARVTRQAAHYHLRRLVESGELEAIGAGRASRYSRPSIWTRRFDIGGLEEHLVWGSLVESVSEVATLAVPAQQIARFAFTEMLNNAIDHSGSDTVSVSALRSDPGSVFAIADQGVGAFEHVKQSKRLEDHLAAIQEISKGKLTTDPERHSGQGIFFTSKAVDVFSLTANGWRWTVDNLRQDSSIAQTRDIAGTRVQFQVGRDVARSLEEVFGQYTDDETFAFDKSRTVVKLFEFDVSFVSRSEAKRLTRNLEKFREVVVDFRGVSEIGQAFADEVFRVWSREHQDTILIPVNMNEPITRFVEQARFR